jgi:hypothetical protein
MVKKIIETVKDKEYVARYYKTVQEALDSIPSHLDCDIQIELIGNASDLCLNIGGNP